MSTEKLSIKEQTQKYKRDHAKMHPEIRERYRQTENANYLLRCGWTLTPPVGFKWKKVIK